MPVQGSDNNGGKLGNDGTTGALSVKMFDVAHQVDRSAMNQMPAAESQKMQAKVAARAARAARTARTGRAGQLAAAKSTKSARKGGQSGCTCSTRFTCQKRPNCFFRWAAAAAGDFRTIGTTHASKGSRCTGEAGAILDNYSRRAVSPGVVVRPVPAQQTAQACWLATG